MALDLALKAVSLALVIVDSLNKKEIKMISRLLNFEVEPAGYLASMKEVEAPNSINSSVNQSGFSHTVFTKSN